MKNNYEIYGDVTAILVDYKGRVIETLIDTCDLEVAMLISGSWTARVTVHNRNKFYIYGFDRISKMQISLARLLMGFPDGLVVDHINDDTLDNRRSCNLQSITNSENIKKQIKRTGPRKPYTTVRRKMESLGIPVGW